MTLKSFFFLNNPANLRKNYINFINILKANVKGVSNF